MGDIARYSCDECKEWSEAWILKHAKAVRKAGPFDVDK